MLKQKNEHENTKIRKSYILILLFSVVLITIALFFFRKFTDDIVDDITWKISLQYSKELNAQMSSHISSTLDYYSHEMNTYYNALKYIEELDGDKLVKYISNLEDINEIDYLAFIDDVGYVYESDGIYLGTMRVPLIGKLISEKNDVVTDNITIGNDSYILMGFFLKIL